MFFLKQKTTNIKPTNIKPLQTGYIVISNKRGHLYSCSLERLNVIHRHGLRLCLGAFKSSPIESPLELRREELAMRYALKIKSHPDNATFKSVFKERGRINLECLGMCIDRLFQEASIDTNKIMTSCVPEVPIWNSEPNDAPSGTVKGFLIMRTDNVIVCLPSRETPTGVLMSPYGRFVLALNKQVFFKIKTA